jgi:predicted nuclease of predicted toxin-antitoxin system
VRVLFDQGTPVPLRKHLSAHQVTTTFELDWNNLKNGELLQKAEENGFSVLVTTDQNLRYQQNLTGRKIAVVILTTTSWPRIEHATASVIKAIDSAAPGSYVEVAIP